MLFLRCYWTVLHHNDYLSRSAVVDMCPSKRVRHLTQVILQSFGSCTRVSSSGHWPFWVELYNGLSEMSLVSVQFQNKRACLAKYEAYDVWSSNNRRLYSLTLLSCQAGANNTTLMQHGASDSCSDWHHTNNMVWTPQVSWKRPLAKDNSAWEWKEGKPR